MDQFVYEIGEEIYVQKQLVLGQMMQLFEELQNIRFPSVVTPTAVVMSVGLKMPKVIAIVLQKKGEKISDKNLDEVQSHIKNYMIMEQAIQIVTDFFDCNPIASISEGMIGLTKKVSETMKATPPEKLSSDSVSSSPAEI